MTIHKRLFLTYLILIFIVSSLFVLIERCSYFFPKTPYFIYPAVSIIVFILIFISYLFSHIFALRIKEIFDRLKKIEEETQESIHVQPKDELENLSQLINRVSLKVKMDEQKLNVLFEITRLVASLLHLQDVLDTIVDLLTKEFSLDACSIRLLDDDGNLTIRSQKGLSKKFVEAATRKPTIDSYSGECFLTGKIVIVNDAKKIDKPISTNLLVSENIDSFAVTPIKVEGDTIGVLITASRHKYYFHERFYDVIYTISNEIGIAIRISQLYDEIYNSSQQLEINVQKRTDELKSKSAQLVEAERLAALGQMANRVAHELRNPLTVVGGFARRMYEKMPDDDKNKKYLKIILEEVTLLEKKVAEVIKIKHEA